MKFKKKLTAAFTIALVFLCSPVAYANKILNSIVGKGTIDMAKDLNGFILVLAPIVATVCVGYFLSRRSAANEHEGATWNKRIVIAIICGVVVFLAAGIIELLASYYR